MIKVTVIPSKDPPEVVRKRLEEAVRRFFLAVEKEKIEKEKSAFTDQSRERSIDGLRL